MKLLDANVLLYAVNADFPHHARARALMEEALNGAEPVGFAWIVLLAFLRLSTKSGVFERPLSIGEAFDAVESWLTQPPATIIHPTVRHASILRHLVETLGTGGNLASDAHLAALAIEHGADLCSFDADFRRFPGVRWLDAAA